MLKPKNPAVPEQKLENSFLNINAAQKINFFLPSRGRTRSLSLDNPPNDLCLGTAAKNLILNTVVVCFAAFTINSAFAAMPQSGSCSFSSSGLSWTVNAKGKLKVFSIRGAREYLCVSAANVNYDSSGWLNFVKGKVSQIYKNNDGTWTVQACGFNQRNVSCKQRKLNS